MKKYVCTVLVTAAIILMTGCRLHGHVGHDEILESQVATTETQVATTTESQTETPETQTEMPESQVDTEEYLYPEFVSSDELTEETYKGLSSESFQKNDIYQIDGYRFDRFVASIYVGPIDGPGDAELVGSSFVIDDHQIWFIDDERNVCSFSFKEYEYTDTDWLDFEEVRKMVQQSPQYHVYGNVDDPEGEPSVDFSWGERSVEGERIRVGIENCTVIFEDNCVKTYSNGVRTSESYFPFTFKEVGYNDFEEEDVNLCTEEVEVHKTILQFVSTSNDVGTITITEILKWNETFYEDICDPQISYNIVAEGKKGVERHLYIPKEPFEEVYTWNGYVVYTQQEGIYASDGNLQIDMLERDYQFEDLSGQGDYWTWGKGKIGGAFLEVDVETFKRLQAD